MLQHLSRLGLWVNWKKVKALPCAESPFSLYGVGLCRHDGVSQQRAHPISAEPTEFLQRQDGGITEAISEAPRAYGIHGRCHAVQTAPYETTSALVTQPSPEMGIAPWHTSHDNHADVLQHIQPLVGPSLSMGWGALRTSVPACCHDKCLQDATCNGQVTLGSLAGPRLLWHINCLELLAVLLAFGGSCCSCKASTCLSILTTLWLVSYINRQGGLQSRHMSQLARHLLICSQTQLKSLKESCASQSLSWCFGVMCQLVIAAPTIAGNDWTIQWKMRRTHWLKTWHWGGSLAHGKENGPGAYTSMCSPSKPSCTDTVQGQGGQGTGLAGHTLLAHLDLVSGTHAPCDSPSLVDSPKE